MIQRKASLFAFLILSATSASAFQGGRVSPHDTVSVNLGGKQITISYGRPSLKNREFGKEVAPFGQVWRLGADEATKITLPAATIVANDHTIPAGSYSLWTIPQANKWTVIVNKQADVWGTNYDQSQDLVRFDLPVKKGVPVDQFTTTITADGNNSAKVSFAWGTASVTMPLRLK